MESQAAPQVPAAEPAEGRLRLLGPLELVQSGRPVLLGGSRQNRLLAVLALSAPAVVSYDRITEALWDAAPDSMRQQVHNAIGRLRKALAPLPELEILTVEGGYQLRIPPHWLDLSDLREILKRSEDAEAAGELEYAADLLAAALALWRGPALSNLDGRYLRTAATELDEQRISALERLTSLRLALGTGSTMTVQLATAVAQHPLRESLRVGLMLALSQSGRQPEALAVYEEGRRLLADELGLDPGDRLRDAHAKVLRGDEPARRAVTGPASPDDQPDTPGTARFLPRDTAEFVGRDEEIEELVHTAELGAAQSLVISSIEGMGGVGKTALAVHLAHRLADRYPDGHYFVDLHGYSPGSDPVSPMAALEALLGQFGVPAELVPGTLAGRSARWRSLLVGRRALIVLDNAVDETQLRPLLPGSPESLVLITCRRRLTALEDNRPMLLRVLSPSEGVQLFTTVVGDHRAGAGRPEVAEVVELCGRLPLAIRIAAARYRDRPGWQLKDLLERLRDQRRRATFLAVGDRSVMTALRMSYVHLQPAQQRLFRLLSLSPAADFDVFDAAALAGISPAEADAVLELLLESSLLTQQTAGRYEFHDLVRDCSRELRDELDDEQTQRVALHRLLDYYLVVAHLCCGERAIGPFRFEPTVRYQPVELPDLGTADQRDRFLRDNYRGFLAAARMARDAGWPVHAWQLPCLVMPFLSSLNYSDESIELFTGAHAAAVGDGNRHGEVATLMAIAVITRDRGNIIAAQDLFRQAIQANDAEPNRAWEAQLRLDLGVAHLNSGQVEPAAENFERAHELAKELGHGRLIRALANNLGVVCRERGLLAEALRYFAEANETEDGAPASPSIEISGLINVGLVHHLERRFHEAVAVFGQALRVCARIGAERRTAGVHCCLSAVHRSLGDLDAAIEHGRTSLSLARRFSLAEVECMALNALGEAFTSSGDLPRAETVFSEAAGAADRHGVVLQAARASEGFAHVSLARGDQHVARQYWQRALARYSPGVAAAEYPRRHLAALGAAVTCARCETAG